GGRGAVDLLVPDRDVRLEGEAAGDAEGDRGVDDPEAGVVGVGREIRELGVTGLDAEDDVPRGRPRGGAGEQGFLRRGRRGDGGRRRERGDDGGGSVHVGAPCARNRNGISGRGARGR